MASPKAPLLDGNGKKSKDVTLDDGVFAAEIKPHLVHEAVRAEFAADRGGTHKVKTRGLVRGGRAKPWRQKGTGRARAGTIRAPHFQGGGVAFEPRTSFDLKVNKKVRRSALRSALSDHAQNGTLALLDAEKIDKPSTRSAAALVAEWGGEMPLLVVARDEEANLVKSFRNLEKALVTAPSDLEVSQVVWARSVLISESALEAVTGRAQ